MYTDPTHWSRIHEQLLDKGESLRSVSLSEGIARPTLRRIAGQRAGALWRTAALCSD
jgi:lambda repressor-like predicted transcriptional regulator